MILNKDLKIEIMKTHLKIIAFLFVSSIAWGQQAAQYNQYIFNQMVINPAYAGTKEVLNLNSVYTSQWTGLDGAPSTQSLSIETPIFNSMGAGIHIVNDQLGAQSQKSGYGSYSYKLKLTQKLKLSFGLAMGITYYSLNGQDLTKGDLYDPAIPNTTVNKTRFDSKAGLFLYNQRFFAGFSVSELSSNIRKSAELLVAGQVKHYYLTSGYVFDLSENVKFKPSFLLKEDFRAPTNIDFNGFFLFKSKYWLGATFRTGANLINSKDLDQTLRSRDAIVIMTDLNVTPSLRIGYSYTITVSSLSSYAGHEILLGYYFREKTNSKMLTPRYF